MMVTFSSLTVNSRIPTTPELSNHSLARQSILGHRISLPLIMSQSETTTAQVDSQASTLTRLDLTQLRTLSSTLTMRV